MKHENRTDSRRVVELGAVPFPSASQWLQMVPLLPPHPRVHTPRRVWGGMDLQVTPTADHTGNLVFLPQCVPAECFMGSRELCSFMVVFPLLDGAGRRSQLITNTY